ncbi:DUF4435 domain-containing protein [Rossellomorea sp. GCM10028870]|uniref:DUF4435 domain-containing protein n=1 Tax=Rossellomorea sp. GCM10028870 TaxID=3273426 RepID=UPI00361AE318
MKVKEMREQKEVATAGYMEFMKAFKGDDNQLYCIVEGEDSIYYEIRIRNFVIAKNVDRNIRFIRAFNKNEVLRLHRIITSKAKYKNEKIGYFIDRDFDDSINKKEIYETPGYSIENCYTSYETFEKILLSEFNVFEYEEDFNKCVDLYKNRQIEFHQNVLLLNAWIKIQNRLLQSGTDTKMDLKNLKNIKDFISISLDKVSSKYNYETLKRKFPRAVKIDQKELENEINKLIKENLQETLRGKYELDFLHIFLMKLRFDRLSKSNRKVFSEKGKVNLEFKRENILSELSHHAETPKCLYAYLDKLFENEYVKGTLSTG